MAVEPDLELRRHGIVALGMGERGVDHRGVAREETRPNRRWGAESRRREGVQALACGPQPSHCGGKVAGRACNGGGGGRAGRSGAVRTAGLPGSATHTAQPTPRAYSRLSR